MAGIQPAIVTPPKTAAGSLLASAKVVEPRTVVAPTPEREEEKLPPGVEVHSSAVEEVEEVHSEEGMKQVQIKPRRTELRMRVGLEWYSFSAGVKCLVPKIIIPHLEEKGII